MDEIESSPPIWSTGRILVSVVLLAVVFFVVQVVSAVGVLLVELLANPGLDVTAWAEGAEENGFLLSVASILGVCVCVPVIRLIAGSVEARPWKFLGFVSPPRWSYVIYLAAMGAFLIASDTLTWALGRPIVPSFMEAAYSSAGSPVLLFVALTVAAPLFEETAFRGFLLSALRSRGLAGIWCAVLTSFLWTALHIQYDFFILATIFPLGLLLAWARLRTGSILPPLAMHVVANMVAFFQAALQSSDVATHSRVATDVLTRWQ